MSIGSSPRDLAEERVIILDEVMLPADAQGDWIQSWRMEYLPRAQERGLQLRGVWRGWDTDPTRMLTVICWSLPKVGRYWAARWAATEEADVREFWSRTDRLAISRSRRVLANDGLQ